MSDLLFDLPCSWCADPAHCAYECSAMDAAMDAEAQEASELQGQGSLLDPPGNASTANTGARETTFDRSSWELPAWGTYGGTFKRSHAHTLDPFALSDGTVLFASDYYTRRDRTWRADVQVYLDHSWRQDGFGYLIEWEDYGLPECSDEQIIRYVRSVMLYADSGDTVEVACLGSHGRTGTFLALCELTAHEEGKRDARAAIAHVRREHCSRAIETAEQEWYVAKIAAIMDGKRIPKFRKPTPRKPFKGKTNRKRK